MPEVVQEQNAESVRHRSDPPFHLLLEVMPAAAYTTDAGGLISHFNQRAVELWGAGAEGK